MNVVTRWSEACPRRGRYSHNNLKPWRGIRGQASLQRGIDFQEKNHEHCH